MSNVYGMPAIVNVSGKNKVERQLSVVTHASGEARQALVNAKGKVGAAVRSSIALAGLYRIAEAASLGNYKPAAEYFAAKLGQPMIISNRASFEALGDLFTAMVMRAKMAKNGGYVMTKKGDTVMSGPHKAAVELLADAEYLIAQKEALYAARAEAAQAAEPVEPAMPAKRSSRKEERAAA
jgi:hypothetical protein